MGRIEQKQIRELAARVKALEEAGESPAIVRTAPVKIGGWMPTTEELHEVLAGHNPPSTKDYTALEEAKESAFPEPVESDGEPVRVEPEETLKPSPTLQAFDAALKDFEEGRVTEVETALTEPPEPDVEATVGLPKMFAAEKQPEVCPDPEVSDQEPTGINVNQQCYELKMDGGKSWPEVEEITKERRPWMAARLWANEHDLPTPMGINPKKKKKTKKKKGRKPYKPKGKPASDEMLASCYALREQGKSWKEIAEETGGKAVHLMARRWAVKNNLPILK